MSRAKKIAWVGAIISFVIIGVISIAVAVFPELWLDNFETNILSEKYAILY